MSEDAVIRGERSGDLRWAQVEIDGQPLDWQASLELRSHSPTGVEWGYGGSGPSQLALAVLMTVTDERSALDHHQDFKREFIAPIQEDSWEIKVRDVLRWLEARRETE